MLPYCSDEPECYCRFCRLVRLHERNLIIDFLRQEAKHNYEGNTEALLNFMAKLIADGSHDQR